VREQLKAGNPTRAALLLGRYFEIEGRVRHGAKRGRQLGYPTANIGLADTLHPAFGVYAVRAQLYGGGGKWLAGVANIGISPMFNYRTPLLEVHLFDFQGDLYGKHLRVALVDHLRGEMKFDSLDGLIQQMNEDSKRARVTLAWEEWDNAWPASPFVAVGPETGGA
jgi:riboflavin kinase/FMN adenylyltransferase